MRTSYKEGELLTKEDIGLVFRDNEGCEIKIIHFSTGEGIKVIGLSKGNHHLTILNLNGSAVHRGAHGRYENLISFVGPDFTEDKKLRKFEFEGWIGEDTSQPLHTSNQCIHDKETHDTTCHDPIDKQFGHSVTGILNRSLVHSHLSSKQDCKFKFKKWKITMEELPNE